MTMCVILTQNYKVYTYADITTYTHIDNWIAKWMSEWITGWVN